MKTFYLLLFVSISLIVGGFFCPPLGVIDSSVLTAVGELLLFGVILQVPSIINSAKDGKHIRLTKGDFTAEVSSEQTISE